MKNIHYKLFILLITMFSCDTLKGHRGISNSEEESKKKQVFVKRYSIVNASSQKILDKNDSIWLERDWYYGGFFKNDRIGNYYRMVVKLNNSNNYDTLWCIGMKNKDFFENNGNIIHHLFTEIPEDTINVFLYKKHNEQISDSTNIILVSN